MRLEQKAELNRLVNAPLTLARIWRMTLTIMCPAWAFWIFIAEAGLLQAWQANRLTSSSALHLLIVSLCFPVALSFLVAAFFKIDQYLAKPSSRVLQLEDDRIKFNLSTKGGWPWQKMEKFQFSPILEAPELTRLNLFWLHRSRKKIRRRSWSMVLDSSQVQELVSFLRRKKSETPLNFEIETLEQPSAPAKPAAISYLCLSLIMGGILLVLHGVPMLMAAFGPSHSDSVPTSQRLPEQHDELARFITGHFSSREEFRHFLFTLGISLIIAGIVLLVWGYRLINKSPQASVSSKPTESNAPYSS